MSKELTEQYRNGTLPSDFYYFTNGKDFYAIEHHQLKGLPTAKGVEIVAKVPTYDQFVELTEKVDQFSQMEKKVHMLDEENRNLKNVIGNFDKRLKEAEMYLRLVYRSEACYTEAIGGYLEKYGVKNE